MVVVVVAMVMSVRANVRDDDNFHRDGEEKERVWHDGTIHDDSTISDDDMLMSKWVMCECDCAFGSECEWLVMMIADVHDGIMT
eukprot:8615591-Pyramimonas_sp.AAC.1